MVSSCHIQCFTQTGNMQTERCGATLCISCLPPPSFFSPRPDGFTCVLTCPSSFILFCVLPSFCLPVCYWSLRVFFSAFFHPVHLLICVACDCLFVGLWISCLCPLGFVYLYLDCLPGCDPCRCLLNYTSSASGVCISVLLPFLVIFCPKFIPVLTITTLLKKKMLLHKL